MGSMIDLFTGIKNLIIITSLEILEIDILHLLGFVQSKKDTVFIKTIKKFLSFFYNVVSLVNTYF